VVLALDPAYIPGPWTPTYAGRGDRDLIGLRRRGRMMIFRDRVAGGMPGGGAAP
jgi:hypothetical protein